MRCVAVYSGVLHYSDRECGSRTSQPLQRLPFRLLQGVPQQLQRVLLGVSESRVFRLAPHLHQWWRLKAGVAGGRWA